MKTNINALLLVLVAEATIHALAEENKKLREHAAGYDRLRVAHEQLKARCQAAESLCRRNLEVIERQHTYRLNVDIEVQQFKHQVLELGRQNIALAAEAESAAMLEQALDKANRRIDELEVALRIARLPAESRDAVIQMVREAA